MRDNRSLNGAQFYHAEVTLMSLGLYALGGV